MEQYTDSQYDDDLTIGMEDTEESFDTTFVDLFEHSGDDESPISRLKTIVLSIDWEINDEVLSQFNDELIVLKDIWAGDDIKLVYVQALEKISKYIYQQKSDSHPNAIKLLLNFYYNLEKIVVDDTLTEDQGKKILLEDVRKFEQLKQQIAHTAVQQNDGKEQQNHLSHRSGSASDTEHGKAHPILFNLKACILGMDWEITEKELRNLSKEIRLLEERFASSRPKMLFLQGLNALGGYIKLKQSNAHADAFRLLYSFYEGLNTIVSSDLSLQEEKEVLLPEVEKFEQFKKTIAPTITPQALANDYKGEVEKYTEEDEAITPAFADIPDAVHGFQAEEEAADLQIADEGDVTGCLDRFFAEEGPVGTGTTEGHEPQTLTDIDDEDTASRAPDILPQEAQARIDTFFDAEGEVPAEGFNISAEEALKGVDVETEADDDSAEDALPTEEDGGLAPALVESDEENEHGFNPDLAEKRGVVDDQLVMETDGRVAVETGADDDSAEEPFPLVGEELAPALSDSDEDTEAGDRVEDDPEMSDQLAVFLGDESDVWTGSVPDQEEDRLVDTADEAEIKSDVDLFFAEDTADTDNMVAALSGAVVETEADDDSAEEPLPFVGEESTPALSNSDENYEERDRAEDERLIETADDAEIKDEVELFFTADESEKELFRLAPDEQSSTMDVGEEGGDEIIFEPVEESEDADEDIPVAVIEEENGPVDDGLSGFISGVEGEDVLVEENERDNEPGEFRMEILTDEDTIDDGSDAVIDSAEDKDDDPADGTRGDGLAGEEELFTFTSDDTLSDLRTGIVSLGIEINDLIVDAILKEINGLRKRMVSRPVEKTFLQLMLTIVQHIGHYRYEASAEAHGLLLSVFDKLELVQNGGKATDEAQEMLLVETGKVLLWQQKMLERQAVRNDDQRTFTDPLRVTEGIVEPETSVDREEDRIAPETDEQHDFTAVDQSSEGNDEIHQSVTIPEPDREVDDELLLKPDDLDQDIIDENDGFVQEMLASDSESEGVTVFVKQEIDALRESLQTEIKELKSQLEGKKE